MEKLGLGVKLHRGNKRFVFKVTNYKNTDKVMLLINTVSESYVDSVATLTDAEKDSAN